VFYGRVAKVAAVRQAALDVAYGAHPERFPNGPPRVSLPPPAVYINPIVTGTVDLTTTRSRDDVAQATGTTNAS
jgi:hypothetical protein